MISQAMLLQCGALHNTLVRLTLKLPQHEQPHGHYQLIDSIRSSLPDPLAASAVPYAATSNSIQYVCHKGAAAKLYKSLSSLKQQLNFELEDVRSCITLQPMPLRQLDDVATAAISCSLRHAASNSSSSGSLAPISSRAGLELYTHRAWHMLRPGCYISTDVAAALPGALCYALYAEVDVTAQQPDKLLLHFLKAGAVKFRPFSPMHALLADAGGALPSPLAATDADSAVLGCPDKLRTANRLLQGRPCCLLPLLTPAVVVKVRGPPSPAALQQLQQQWLQQHLLQLPAAIPFLLELAPHAESDDTLLVPSCCVWTSMGLAQVLPGAAEYVSGREVQQVVVRDVCEGGGCALWGSKAPVALGPEKAAAGPSAVAGSTPLPPAAAAFTYKASWSKASALMSQDLPLLQLEAVAAGATPPAAGRAAGGEGGNGGRWISAGGLDPRAQQQDADDGELDVHHPPAPAHADVDLGAAAAAAGRSQRPPRPATDFSQLKAFLAKHKEQQQAAATAGLPSHPAAPTAAAELADAGGGSTAGAPRMTLQQKLAAAKAAGAAPGKPAAPALRKVPAAGAAATAAKPNAKPAAKRPPTTAAAAAPKAPKKPRSDAAGKAAGKAHVAAPAACAAVVDAGLVNLTAAAAAGAPTATAAAAAANNSAAPAPAAVPAAAAAARKRTKAADLDLGAVTAKLAAAVAGGGVFKGVSVPELQCYLKAHKLGVSGKKAELEAKVVAHMAAAGGVGATAGGGDAGAG